MSEPIADLSSGTGDGSGKLALIESGKHLTTQLSSGRWLLTMASAICIVMMVYTDCRVAYKYVGAPGTIVMPFDITAILTIVATVFTSYFHSNQNKSNGQETKGDS